jgi:hypothetical protein
MPNPEEAFRDTQGTTEGTTDPGREASEARNNQTTLENTEAQELARTGALAAETSKDSPITDVLDEGQPAGHPGGQLRGDQTEGHRGGSRRQTQNRGRD